MGMIIIGPGSISGQAVTTSGNIIITSVSGDVVSTSVSGNSVTTSTSGNYIIALTSGQTPGAISGQRVILQDNLGRQAESTGMGELRVSEHVRLVGASFGGAGTVDSSFWTTVTSANASVTVVGNVLHMTTAASADSAAIVMSQRRGRYIGATPNYARSLTFLPPPTSGNVIRWGAFDSSDGCFWQVDGLNGSSFSSVTRCSTVDTAKPVTGVAYATSNIVTTEIYYKNSQALFSVGDAVVNTHAVSNQPWAYTLTLPFRYENVNVSGTVNVVNFRSLSGTINRMGKEYTRPQYATCGSNDVTYLLKASAGTLHSVVIADQGGNPNFLYLKDGTTSGTAPFMSIDTTNATEGVWNFDIDFYTGLVAVLAGGTPAKITVVYE